VHQCYNARVHAADKESRAVKLSREQVLHIAELAKLGITEEETERFAEQLSEILDYAEMLNRLDTAAIPPTAQAIAQCNVTRPDQVRPSLTPAEVLANAPQRQGDYFRVKPILD
jgi:aspartyl-tRNA(Asn)/glutamyl-tRNA(Gln) amidotransferase subunit C